MCLSVEICAHECRYWQRPEITELEMQLQMVESCLHALKHWAIFPTVGYSWQYFHSPGKPNCSIFLLKKKKSVNFILSCGIKAKLKKKKKVQGVSDLTFPITPTQPRCFSFPVLLPVVFMRLSKCLAFPYSLSSTLLAAHHPSPFLTIILLFINMTLRWFITNSKVSFD